MGDYGDLRIEAVKRPPDGPGAAFCQRPLSGGRAAASADAILGFDLISVDRCGAEAWLIRQRAQKDVDDAARARGMDGQAVGRARAETIYPDLAAEMAGAGPAALLSDGETRLIETWRAGEDGELPRQSPDACARPVSALSDCRMATIIWGDYPSDREFARCFERAQQAGAVIIVNVWNRRIPTPPLSPTKSRIIDRAVRKGRHGRGCVVILAEAGGGERIDDPNILQVASAPTHARGVTRPVLGDRICASFAPDGGGWDVVASTGTEWTDTDVIGVGRLRYNAGRATRDRLLAADACSLILAVNPFLSAMDVRLLLEETANPLPAASRSVWRRINAYEAVRAAQEAPGAIAPLTADWPSRRALF